MISSEPARKIFIKQCSDLISDTDSEESKTLKRWIYNKNTPVSLELVWIQGIIVDVAEEEIVIDDGSGKATIVSIKSTVGYGLWIKKGRYLMLFGEVLAIEPDVKIKPIKFTELPEPNAEISWILEVIDFWKFMQQPS